VRIHKWFLNRKKLIKRLYITAYVVWQTLFAMVVMVWIGTIGGLLSYIPPLNTLPKHIPICLGLGLGCLVMIMAVIGFVIVCCVLTEEWLKRTRRAINKRVRERIWGLEYTVQEAEDKERRMRFELQQKLNELKNASWEV
jgi:hypothetical protein